MRGLNTAIVMPFSLTTAEIIYRLPDHLSLLQTYIWQEYDIYPRFPKLHIFLDFWACNLAGPLHSVRVAHRELAGPVTFRLPAYEGQLLH